MPKIPSIPKIHFRRLTPVRRRPRPEKCIFCGSDYLLWQGWRKNKRGRVHKIKCAHCNKKWTVDNRYSKSKTPKEIDAIIIKLAYQGQSMRKISATLQETLNYKITHTAILKKVKKYASDIKLSHSHPCDKALRQRIREGVLKYYATRAEVLQTKF